MGKWIGLGIFATIVLALVLAFSSTYNNAVKMEETIIAAHDQSKNVLGQHAPKLKEALGVTELQTDSLLKLYAASNESRYGKDGSQATMQWIKEQNPNLDQSNYGKVITMLEASRNDFMAAQQVKIDKVRAYRGLTRSFFTGTILGIAGFPKQAVDEQGRDVDFFAYYGKVVVSGHANNSFQTGIDDGVDIKPKTVVQ
jgi:hypothetical protein